MEAPRNTDFHTWMGKKHFCFFQTAESGNRTPNSGVKGSGANHYPRAPALSASNDGQDASGLAPDVINFMKNQPFDYSFVSSAGIAPAVLTIENMMGSDLPTRFGPVGF